ncbi:cell surface protein SprA [Flavobacteriaceae bacterium S356]|uniref:Cell surface protein SprA n=2 Tax=Asprobacillus argus TaxID=3076534 RepID=A0ABU3LHZ6_9FLAO|nr:cell surface protein SprA [Flavobacteriaceae bacterium S356]
MLLFTLGVNGVMHAQTKSDSTAVKKDTTKLRYNFTHFQKGGLFLKDPSKLKVIFDKVLNKYVFLEKIGDYYVRVPIYMTPEEYAKYRLQRDMLEYFKNKVRATNSKLKGAKDAQKNLLPTYYVNSKFFTDIFGSNKIQITPSGSINLKLGFIYQNTDNPQLSEQNRSSFTFDFDQQINASIQAKVGDRLQLTANYDTQSTFDFQNLIKIEYTPTEDDILQGIEAGNVAMPIKNSLINGSQSLFGVKAKLQFGKTHITTVFSQQNSESTTVTAQAGSSIQEFELRTTDYDTDRHFFLSQFFRNNYANALKNYPLISSPVNITRVEVWITNRSASVEDFRSIVAFADIGESDPSRLVNTLVYDAASPNQPPSVSITGQPTNLPDNGANDIFNLLSGNGIRDISTVDNTLQTTPSFTGPPLNMQQGTDYSLLQNARKLSPNEFTLHPQLGFISLQRRLNDGEVLAVAYEYTVVGSTETSYKVGEFSNDGVLAPSNLAVKLLRSEILTTKRTVAGVEEAFPTWDLMMKNVYALGAFPLTQDGFRFEVQYRDDQTGIPSNTLQNALTPGISTQPLLRVMHLDQLDQSQFQNSDGFFDYVEGITVNSQNGYVIFPEPEPFGTNLEDQLTVQSDIDTYVFKELYLETKINAKNNFQNKDKYLLKGYFKSDNAGGIPLNAFNVPRGSVTVTAGGRQLVEGIDFVVDYQLGRVQIIDPGLQSSGTPIQVSTENNSVFNQQRKTFMGVDVEHRFSDNFVLGGTILNVNERPLTPKVNFGQEPINNTMFGVNVDYSSEVPYLTKLVNKLPFVDTDAPSNFSIRADMAYLLPGSPSGIDVTGQATSYIDDFEASQIPISLLTPLDWHTASTPREFPGFNGNSDQLDYNFGRSRFAWYNIDQIFYGAGPSPGNISADDLSRAETRQINFRELFPNVELDVTQNALIRTLDFAFFPNERGTYNYDTGINVNTDGTFNNPEDRWGGIMRALTTNNFDQANVEYIQFWVMDPYENYSITNAEGLPAGVNPQDAQNQVGELYFHLGNISEDILKDNRKMYENGLPADGLKVNNVNVTRTNWGDMPLAQSILYAFDESDASRTNQDLGLDGLTNLEEANKIKADLGLTDAQIATIFNGDPSSDDFVYYRGSNQDAVDASIISRYKFFNNTQGNSPTLNQSPESFPTSSTTYPDVEDINRDQTMNTVESYYEYKVSLNKNDLVVGQNFIVDSKTTEVTLENGATQNTTWYQFRVPIRSGTPVNGISDFNSIRFIRMFMTKFKMPVVLRFGELDLVRGDWRRYVRTLDPAIVPDQELTLAELNSFEVGVVNIEQNEGRYVLPPGIERERLQGSTTVQQQNEQSVSLKVTDLPQNKIRAIYKNISVDLRRYKQLKMFMHVDDFFVTNMSQNIVEDDDLVAIIRLGTDLNDNFYQIEIPLKVSANDASQPTTVWPELNNLEAAIEEFGKIKLTRDADNAPINQLYPTPSPTDPKQFTIRVKGNPTMAQIRTVMLGVKNTVAADRSAEIWFNELRSSGFDNDGGWAAVVNADANFADIADISVSGRMQTIGFGNVEDRVSQRSLDETKQYNVTTSVNLGKMMPKKWGIQLPMNYSIGEEFKDPKFDPQYQDVVLSDAVESNPNSQFSRDYTKRRSISFINVKKNRNPASTKKPRFYDVENVAVSYAYNEEYHRDYNIQKYANKTVTATASYNFSPKSKFIEPFKNSKALRSKYLQLLRDLNINPIPTTIAVNTRINRNFSEQQSRNLVTGLSPQPKLTQRRFLFDWDYTIGLDLTKSISVNFNATNSYIYDSFGSNEELEIFDKFFAVGRPDHYHQKLNATYKLPINKIPYLNFITADYGYTADFDWRAASQSYVDLIGNMIQNANTHNINTTFNFARFYRDIKLENLIKKKKKRAQTPKGLPRGPRQVSTTKKKSVGQKIIKGIYDVVTSVKTGKISYAENNGQLLPGYTPEFNFFGGPTTAFAFGSQVDIRTRALQNGWLISRAPNDEYYNRTYSRTHYNKLDYNFSLKPFKDLSIEVRGNKINTRDLSQQLDVVDNVIQDTPAFETGNFSTSFSMFSTSFKNNDQLFQTFRDYRATIATRLAAETGLPVSGYQETSQQVLLPAFIAAYSGKDPNKVETGLFRNIPIPNWNLRYNGFMKFKWFKKNFSNFSVSHGYNSSYTVSSFSNNFQYDEANPSGTNSSGSYHPELLVSAVTLVDEFSPLIKVDMKMRNSFSFIGEVRKDRTLTMNFNNNTLTDIKGIEYVFGIGYIIKDVKMTTRFTGKKETLKGDVNIRADVSLRDNLTLIRSIDVDNDQISGGQKLFSLKLTADYRLNSNLTASFYYNHQTSKYAISTTFPRQTINGGFNIIYNLGN